MERFYRLVLRYPKSVLLAVAAVTVLLAAQLPHLRKDDSVDKMLPDGDPIREYTRQIEEVFASDEFLVVAVESPDPFNAATVRKIVRMTQAFQAVPGVREVISLSTAKNMHGGRGELFSSPFVDESRPPETSEELEALKAALHAKEIFRATLLSEDGRAFGLFLRLEKNPDKKTVVNTVERVVAKEQGPERVYFSGSPAINLQVGKYMARDMGRFFPLAAALILGMLTLSFRSVRGVLLPFGALVLTVLWTLGLMAWSRTPLSVIGTMIPTLLIAAGSSYGIHVLTRYYQDLPGRTDKAEALLEALLRVNPTIALSGITTVIGFAALMVNRTPILREFGFFMALGVLIAMAVAVTFVPAFLALLPIPPPERKKTSESGAMARVLAALARFNASRGRLSLAAAAGLVAFGALGYSRLQIETNAVNFFRDDDPVRRVIADVSNQFGGTIPIRTVIEAPGPGKILEPRTLREMEALQRYLETFPRIGKTLSIADMIKDMNRAVHEGDQSWHRLPETKEEAEQLLFLYSLGSKPDEFESLIDTEHSKATVTARLRQVDARNEPLGTRETKQILEQLTAFAAATFSPALKVTPTGRAQDIVRTSDYIVKGLLQGTALSVVFICLTAAAYFRSWAAGLFSILTVSAALFVNYGVMGWLGIPLDIATTLIASMVGIGVDDSLHYLLWHRRAVAVQGIQHEVAGDWAIRSAGRAMIYTSLALVLGYSVLLVASFKPVIYFGGLTALTMANTTLGALLLLPVSLAAAKPRFLSRRDVPSSEK